MSQGIRHAPFPTFLATGLPETLAQGREPELILSAVLLKKNVSLSTVLLVQHVKDLADCLKSKVENIGLEPMTSCMPCKRSSQLS